MSGIVFQSAEQLRADLEGLGIGVAGAGGGAGKKSV
jgi:hypothetical protein